MSTAKDYFQTRKTQKLIAIGYWHSIFEPDLPDPAWFIDEQWSAAESKLVENHLKKGYFLEDWKGKSWCRFRCGAINMRSSDLTDGTYIFPEGLVHYLEVHQVRLPEEFIRHVQHYKPVEINFGLQHCDIAEDWWKGQKGWSSQQKSYIAPNDDLLESYKRQQALEKKNQGTS